MSEKKITKKDKSKEDNPKIFGILKVNMSKGMEGEIFIDSKSIVESIKTLTYEYQCIDGVRQHKVLITLKDGQQYSIDNDTYNRVNIEANIK